MKRFILILPLFCCLVFSQHASAVLVDEISAIVNNEPILNSEVQKFYRLYDLRHDIDPFFMIVDGLESKTPPRERVVEYLIQEKLIASNFKVQEVEVDDQINEITRNNNTTREGLEEFIRSKGFNFQDYRDLIRIARQKQALLDREIRSRVNISDDEVKSHYTSNASKNKDTPQEYSLQMIVLNIKNYKSTKFAKETAEKTFQSITDGEPFGEVAKRVSDDPSGPHGGDLGFIAGEHLNAQLLGHVKDLKIGEVSRPLQINNSYYIVKLNDVASLHNKKLEANKEQIREQLAKIEYKRQLSLWTARTKSSTFIFINP